MLFLYILFGIRNVDILKLKYIISINIVEFSNCLSANSILYSQPFYCIIYLYYMIYILTNIIIIRYELQIIRLNIIFIPKYYNILNTISLTSWKDQPSQERRFICMVFNLSYLQSHRIFYSFYLIQIWEYLTIQSY